MATTGAVHQRQSGSRLAEVKTKNLSAQQLRELLPPSEQDWYDKIEEQNPEVTEQVKIEIGSLFLEISANQAEQRNKAIIDYVDTHNTGAHIYTAEYFDGLRALIQEHQPIGQASSKVTLANAIQAALPLHTYRYLRAGGHRISLAHYNTAVNLTLTNFIPRPDGDAICADMMKHKAWGPVQKLIEALQKVGSIEFSYKGSKNAVQMFNGLKRYDIPDTSGTSARINSTILDHTPPIADYQSRRFVKYIMAGVPYIVWEEYLRRTANIDFTTILAGYRRHLRQQIVDGVEIDLNNPATISGAVLSDGVWQWYLDQNPELAKEHNLPRRLRSTVRETCLQFPLVESLLWEIQNCASIGWNLPIRDVYEQGGKVFATVNGQERQIAHRVKIVRFDKGRPYHAELDPADNWQEHPLHIDYTLELCYSAELAETITICEVGQYWGFDCSQWEFDWTNTPQDSLLLNIGRQILRNPVKSFTGVWIFTGIRAGYRLYKEFKQLEAENKRETEAILARYDQETDQFLEDFKQQMLELLRHSTTTYQQLGTLRRTWRRIHLRRRDYYTSSHNERVIDFAGLMLIYLAGYRKTADIAAILTPDIETLAPKYLQDPRFLSVRKVVWLVMLGACLHDIGKTGIPTRILNAISGLNDEDFEVMKGHVTFTRQFCQVLYPQFPVAGRIGWNHHEKKDGSGYSQGLTAEELGLLELFLAIVDMFDGMLGKRPYRPKDLSLEFVFGSLMNEAKRDKSDGWLTLQVFNAIRWIQVTLVPLDPMSLRQLGLSKATIHLIKTRMVPVLADEGKIDTIIRDAETRFASLAPVIDWELLASAA